MYCSKCGEEVNKKAIFCSQCGERILQDNKCQHCGNVLKEDMVFCPICGKKRNESSSLNEEVTTLQTENAISDGIDDDDEIINNKKAMEITEKNKNMVIRFIELVFSIIIIVLCCNPMISIPRYDYSSIYGEITFGQIMQLAKMYDESAVYWVALGGYIMVGVEIFSMCCIVLRKKFSNIVTSIRFCEVNFLVFFFLIVKIKMEGMVLTGNFIILCIAILLALIFSPDAILEHFAGREEEECEENEM